MAALKWPFSSISEDKYEGCGPHYLAISGNPFTFATKDRL